MGKIIHSDSLIYLKTMSDNSVDAIVTDPPYGLSFMGKKWDYDVPSVELWREALRVLKPGGHLLSFGGTRTYHRMVVNIEDAGFEIRDQIQWLYGSGFPKSLDAKKQFSKQYSCQFLKNVNLAEKQLKLFPVELQGEKIGFVAVNVQIQQEEEKVPLMVIGVEVGSKEETDILLLESTEPIDLNTILFWKKRLEESLKNQNNAITLTELKTIIDLKICNVFQYRNTLKSIDVQNHTALKPANEPIVLARKPLLEKTVAKNVLEHGTGGINVDGCRIGDEERINRPAGNKPGGNSYQMSAVGMPKDAQPRAAVGRFPANLILDEEAAAMLDEQSGIIKSGGYPNDGGERSHNGIYGKPNVRKDGDIGPNSGGASRFFYCAKASKSERGHSNNHPTVKPLKLMRYLCRLITPPCGVVLDPFMGSGSTGVAAIKEGFKFIGIEREAEYVEIARRRLAPTPQADQDKEER